MTRTLHQPSAPTKDFSTIPPLAHFVNTIKHQLFLLDDQPERVPPIPSVILDDPMSVDLDPQVEDDEDRAEYPTEDVGEDGLVGG